MKKLLLVLLLIASPAYATTYYVNKSGNNSNSCATAQSTTDASAKLTIAAGLTCLASGDTLIIGDGTYTERIANAVPSGSSGAPTIVKAENRNQAILRPSGGFYVVEISIARSYITFDGLDADGVNTNSDVYYIASETGTVSYIRIINGKARNAQYDGSYGGVNVQCGAHANVSGHHHIEVSNMDISGSEHDSTDGSGGYGIYVTCHDSLFEKNNIFDNDGYGFHQYAGGGSGIDNNIIRNNRIDATGQLTGLSTDAVAAILISAGDGNLYYNNLIYGAPAHGIFVYASSSNLGLYFNTFYGNTGGTCIVLNSGTGVASTTIRNNICYGNGSDSIDNGGTGTTSSNNLFTDPTFVLASAYDFHLQPTSAALPPCGTNVASVTTDFDDITRGSPPSCGAYEVPSGSIPGADLLEDFQSYTATTSINGLNGGTGWTQTWQLIDGTATVENTSCGLTGKVLRTTAVVDTEVRRFFTAKTGSFTIQAKMCMDTTSHNNLVGISLIDQAGGYQIAVWFSASGNVLLYDNGALATLTTYAVNTSYRVRFNFDTVNQPGKVRISVNDEPYGSWLNTVSSFTSIGGIFVNNYSTSAHTFELDDINNDGGPPILPPAATTPVGIRARVRGRI